MIRTLAVIVPGNNVTVRQREDTGLNVVADHDGLDVFHLVVRHLNAFSLRDGQIPVVTHSRSRQSRLCLDIRVADDFCPLRDFELDTGGKFFRRIRDWLAP
jgi:hypothetical protein